MKSEALVTTESVSAANAIKTPQFWLLWVVLFCNVTAGIGILEQASPMIQDFFRDGGESSVAAAAAAGFVGLLSICNMAGRFVWSSTSDVIGRKPIYLVYLGVGMVLYVLLAIVGHNTTGLFVLFAGMIISFYGGGFATVPAYLRDLFGTFQVGAIHGRLLTAWSAAGIAGPLIVNGFLDAEGKPGTLTYEAYRPALFTMVGVLAVGFVANLLIRQVADRFHEPDHEESQLVGEPAGGGGVATATRTGTTSRHAPGAARHLLDGRRAAARLRRLPDVREGLGTPVTRRGGWATCSIHPWDQATRAEWQGVLGDGRLRTAGHRRARRRLPGRRTHALRVRRGRHRAAAPGSAQPGLARARRGPARRAGARPRTGRTSRRPGTPTPAPTPTSVSPRSTTPASSCSAVPRSSTTRTRRRRSWPPQLAHFEPSGSTRVTPSPDVESDRRVLPGIRGLRLHVEAVRAKMKYGGNKTPEHRSDIAERLALRDAPGDRAARDHLLRRA